MTVSDVETGSGCVFAGSKQLEAVGRDERSGVGEDPGV